MSKELNEDLQEEVLDNEELDSELNEGEEEKEEVQEEETITVKKSEWEKANKDKETALKQKQHWREVAEKKDGGKKDGEQQTLSEKDRYALYKSNIDPDHFDEVKSFANYKGVPIAEALNSPVLKAAIEELNNEKAARIGANRKKPQGGELKMTDEAIIQRFKDGKHPSTDAEREQLFWALRGGKR